RAIGRVIFFCISIVVLSVFISTYLHINWLIEFGLTIIGGILLAILTGMLDFKFAAEFLKKKV
ncbi:MAG: hypothetical protein AAF573_22125, partial [Bacteroidota bacterium]